MESTRSSHLHLFTLIGYASIFLITDVLVYGLFVPLLGVWIASSVSVLLELPPFQELVGVVFCVCVEFYVLLSLNLESKFWKRLFSSAKGYAFILKLRDFYNIFCLMGHLKLLCDAIISPPGIKTNYLGEGIGFVFWNGLSEWNFPVPEGIKDHYRWTRELEESNKTFWKWLIMDGDSIAEQNLKTAQMVNAAKFVFGIAGISSSVMKIVYFNTLHIYTRSMKIFMTMQDASPPRTRRQSMESLVSDYVSDFTFNVKPSNPKVPVTSPMRG